MPTASSPVDHPSRSHRGFMLVVLAALCWGTSGISGRIIADRTELSPLDIAWYRLALGAAVLLAGWALTARRRARAAPVTRRVAVRLVLVGAGLAAYQLVYFSAVARAGVSIATLDNATSRVLRSLRQARFMRDARAVAAAVSPQTLYSNRYSIQP